MESWSLSWNSELPQGAWAPELILLLWVLMEVNLINLVGAQWSKETVQGDPVGHFLGTLV